MSLSTSTAHVVSPRPKLSNQYYSQSLAPEEARKDETDSSVQAKTKYGEVKMPDGRSLVDLIGDDDE